MALVWLFGRRESERERKKKKKGKRKELFGSRGFLFSSCTPLFLSSLSLFFLPPHHSPAFCAFSLCTIFIPSVFLGPFRFQKQNPRPDSTMHVNLTRPRQIRSVGIGRQLVPFTRRGGAFVQLACSVSIISVGGRFLCFWVTVF